MDELNRRYISGTMEFIRKHRPDLYRKTDDAEDELNEVWKAGLQGKSTTQGFREVLGRWYLLNLRGIHIYSEATARQGKS